MLGSNNFLEWNPNANNQENNPNYVGDSQRSNGAPNSAGGTLFPSLTGNKLFRQISLMVASLGQMLANKGYTISDGDGTGFTPPAQSAAMTNLIGQLANIMTLADFPALISGSGWMKFPNGLILQWGSVYCSPNAGSLVYYPIIFPNAVLIPLTTVCTGGVNNYAFSAAVVSQTASYMYVNLAGPGSATTVYFLLLGY